MKKLRIHLRSEGIKYHKDLTQLVGGILKSKFVKLNKKNTPFKDIRGKMTLSNRGFNINLPQINFLSDIQIGKTYKGIELSSKIIPTIIIDDLYINKLGSKGCNGQIGRFHSKGYSEKKQYYYKAVIPISTRFNFYETLEQIHFINDFEVSSVNATRVLIQSDEIEIFCIENDAKENFILIESNTKQTYNAFSEKVFAIKIGLAYINTKYLGDHCFYVSYSKKGKAVPSHFLYQEQRPTNSSTYYPININPNTFSVFFKNKLRKLSITEFSKLVECMFDSVDFRSVLLLIIESNKASLLLRPGAYAIALESLTDIIVNKEKKEKKPITDNNLRKKIVDECISVIKNNSETLSPESIEILTGKIKNINQVTNKSRLREPFDILNIHLSDEDLKILDARNDFLHGRVPNLTGEIKRSINRTDRDLHYSSLRFYVLLNTLILKFIGYDNYVVNYPKIHQSSTKIKLPKEKSYRKV